MKPMGLEDPRTHRRPYAVVQLRSEDLRSSGLQPGSKFENHVRFGDQQRVLRMIPGLEHAGDSCATARFIATPISTAPRYSTTRCCFAPLRESFSPGRVSGVEGYVESIATGLIANRAAAGAALSAKASRSFPHARRPLDRFARTSPAPTRRTISPPISRSICCRSSIIRRATASSAMRRCAGGGALPLLEEFPACPKSGSTSERRSGSSNDI